MFLYSGHSWWISPGFSTFARLTTFGRHSRRLLVDTSGCSWTVNHNDYNPDASLPWFEILFG